MKTLLRCLCLTICVTTFSCVQTTEVNASDPWTDLVEKCEGDYPVFADGHEVFWNNGTLSTKNADGTWTNRDIHGNVWVSKYPTSRWYYVLMQFGGFRF